MSSKKGLNLRELNRRIHTNSLDVSLLSKVIGKPSYRIVNGLSGKQPFNYIELLAIADLINCEISDLLS